MTGPLVFDNDSSNAQTTVFAAAASGQVAGLQVEDYNGANVVVETLADGSNNGRSRMYASGAVITTVS